MASIEKRISKSGERTYHITVCAGYGPDGKKVRRRTTYKPDANMSDKQADKAAQKEAFRFEQQLEQGYVMEDNQRFQEYAEYVLELKLRNGLKRSTYERYLMLLPKINEAIGTMRLRDIRPMHLNNFYGQLSKPGTRIANNKAIATKDIQSMLKKLKMSKSALAKEAGVSPQVITSICRQQPVLKRAGEAVAKALGKDYSKIFRTEVDQKPLSTKTILEYHRLTCAILSQAEKEMLVPYNAAKKATPPKNQ